MNSPPVLLRFVEVLVRGFFNCVRFFTAPLRALSPIGLLIAIVASCFDYNAWQKCLFRIRNRPSASALSGSKHEEDVMGFGRGALLWLIGIPLPIILLLAVFMHH
jgi:hypothetical protein